MAELKQKENISSETVSAIFIIVFVALFVMVNLFFGFVWPLYILAMVAGFVISIKYPKSGLLAIIFLTIIFERFFTLQTFFIGKVEYKLYPLDILMLGIIIGIFLQYLFGTIKKVQLRKSDFVLIGFVLLNAIYFLFSRFVIHSDSALAFSTLKNYGFYSLLYFITVFLIRDKNDLQKLFKFFLAGAVGIIVFILIGIFRGEGLWSEYTPLSTSGTRILAFTHGLYLLLAFIPMAVYLIFSKIRISKWQYALCIVWLIGIIGTMMRHLWIALALSLGAVYFVVDKGKKVALRNFFIKLAIPFAITAIVVFYAISMVPQSKLNKNVGKVVGVVSERAGSLAQAGQDESYSWRILVWKSAYAEFKHNPLFGIGTGKKVFVETQFYRDFVEVRNIHNSYLAILIQLGILGLGMFIYWICINIKKLFGAENSVLKYVLLSAIIIYIVALNFQPYLETNLLALLFWISMGLIRNYSPH